MFIAHVIAKKAPCGDIARVIVRTLETTLYRNASCELVAGSNILSKQGECISSLETGQVRMPCQAVENCQVAIRLLIDCQGMRGEEFRISSIVLAQRKIKTPDPGNVRMFERA